MNSKVKNCFLIVAFALFAATFAKGTEEELIRSSFASYWEAFTEQEFDGAGEQILPDDLSAAKRYLLPVFLEALKSDDEEVRRMASTFFGSIPEADRAAISPEQVYVCLNAFVAVAAPQMFEALRSSTITVDRVQISGTDATIYYQIDFSGVSEADTEAYVKSDGRWVLRLKEHPRETANKFRMLFE